jgi:hypothetical protein
MTEITAEEVRVKNKVKADNILATTTGNATRET